jgi:hypothetical protein
LLAVARDHRAQSATSGTSSRMARRLLFRPATGFYPILAAGAFRCALVSAPMARRPPPWRSGLVWPVLDPDQVICGFSRPERALGHGVRVLAVACGGELRCAVRECAAIEKQCFRAR